MRFEYQPLRKLVKFSSGGTPKKTNPEFWNGNIPWISAKTMKDERVSTSDLFITEQGLRAGSKLASKGTILLLTRGSGLYKDIPICLVDEPVAFNQDVKCLTPCSEVEIKYIFYWLLANKPFLMAKVDVTGIGAGKFNMDFLENLQVPVPPLEEQNKIISILDSISEKFILNQKISVNLEQQAQALFLSWKTENVGNYKTSPLSEVAAINAGTYTLKSGWDFVNYLDTSSITNGIISEVQHINPLTDKLPSRARRIIKPNDIVFSTVRPNQNHFGIVKEPLDNMLASTGFAVIRSKIPSVSNELLYLCLTENSFIEKMQQLAEQSTSTFPSIKPSDLDNCEIPHPITAELKESLSVIFSEMALREKENKILKNIRDTLLPKLMSGEIDVSEIDI